MAGGNNQKDCYYATNQVSYFDKRVIFTFKRSHANIKRIFDTPLGDLPLIFVVIAEQIEDESHKLTILYSFDKASWIEQGLNIGTFCYLSHEVSKYALKLMSSYWHKINLSTSFPLYTKVFIRTLDLLCWHQM